MFPELKRLIEQMGKDRGIDREIIVKALEAAMLTAARKKLGPDVELEAHYNEEAGEIEVFQFKTVMEKVLDPDLHISVAEARRTLDEEAEPGDSLGIKIDTSTFGRIAVQTAKQIIIQRVKDAERDNIYEEYQDRRGSWSTVSSSDSRAATSSSIWAAPRGSSPCRSRSSRSPTSGESGSGPSSAMSRRSRRDPRSSSPGPIRDSSRPSSRWRSPRSPRG